MLGTDLIRQKYVLNLLDDIYIWQVFLQLSCCTPVKYESNL